MTELRLPVTFTPGEDGYVVATCPLLVGCTTQGKTLDDARRNIIECIQLSLEGERFSEVVAVPV